MTNVELQNAVARLQGAYYLATGVWPWLGMRSFLRATGPKTDLWLVQTVGALVAVIGLAISLEPDKSSKAVRLLGKGSAAALAAVDILFVARGTIPKRYLLDAAAELAIVAAWYLAERQGAAERVGARQRETTQETVAAA